MPKAIKNQDIAEDFLLYFPPYNTDLIYIEEYDLFYLWRDSYYREVKMSEMKSIVHSFCRNKYPSIQITMNMVKDLTEQMKCILPKNRSYRSNTTGYLAFNNGYLNTKTFELEPVDKDKAVIYHLDFEYNGLGLNEEKMPVFNKYLETSLVREDNIAVADKELINFVQEMFGYFLLDGLYGASAFFLVGEGSNGKSVMIDILYSIIGREYCSSMSIQEMTTDKFATEHLVGKKINISNEEESKHMSSFKFKAMITGDPISAERKFGNKFSFRPKTKYIFASNNMPGFDTMDYGMKRRLKIVPFYRVFEDSEQDKELGEKLQEELSQIIVWALIGAKRFIDNKYVFHVARSSKIELSKFEKDISSSLMFIDENYAVDNGSFVSNVNLYQHYVNWCKDNGRKPVSSTRFNKETMKIKGMISKTGWNNGHSERGKNLILKADEPQEIEFL